MKKMNRKLTPWVEIKMACRENSNIRLHKNDKILNFFNMQYDLVYFLHLNFTAVMLSRLRKTESTILCTWRYSSSVGILGHHLFFIYLDEKDCSFKSMLEKSYFLSCLRLSWSLLKNERTRLSLRFQFFKQVSFEKGTFGSFMISLAWFVAISEKR